MNIFKAAPMMVTVLMQICDLDNFKADILLDLYC